VCSRVVCIVHIVYGAVLGHHLHPVDIGYRLLDLVKGRATRIVTGNIYSFPIEVESESLSVFDAAHIRARSHRVQDEVLVRLRLLLQACER